MLFQTNGIVYNGRIIYKTQKKVFILYSNDR